MLSGADRYAARATRASRTSFYYSFVLLPREKRRAIYAIYAFCRAADDVADGPGDPAEKERALRKWREELGRCYAGGPRHPVTEALLPAVRRYRLPREHFEGILDGVASDLTRRRYATFEDLRGYCHRVASLVGLLCVEVFGYRDPASRDYARELGLAFAFATNGHEIIEFDFIAGLEQSVSGFPSPADSGPGCKPPPV